MRPMRHFKLQKIPCEPLMWRRAQGRVTLSLESGWSEFGPASPFPLGGDHWLWEPGRLRGHFRDYSWGRGKESGGGET